MATKEEILSVKLEVGVAKIRQQLEAGNTIFLQAFEFQLERLETKYWWNMFTILVWQFVCSVLILVKRRFLPELQRIMTGGVHSSYPFVMFMKGLTCHFN